MTRPMSEEREKLEPCPFCGGNASRHDPIRVARALLSTSSAERGMREALEMAQKTLRRASRELSENHRLILQGKRWGGETLDAIDAALTPKEGA